jgi:NitT/TauT family transport system substrate-binding protein
LLGQGAGTPDAVGIQFPGGKALGDPGNLKMRFDVKLTQMAENGQL